jgi:preprotein translocase YajC subunit
VVTIGGLIGSVVSLTEDRKEVTLKIADNTRVRVLRTAIQSIVSSKS